MLRNSVRRRVDEAFYLKKKKLLTITISVFLEELRDLRFFRKNIIYVVCAIFCKIYLVWKLKQTPGPDADRKLGQNNINKHKK